MRKYVRRTDRPYIRRDKPCLAGNCSDAVYSRGLCQHHLRGYARKTARPGESVEVRLERYIERDPNSGCWLWSGAVCSRYGRISLNGSQQAAHRAAYEHYVRPLSEGEVVCHRCDTPQCVNPQHLTAATQADNISDMCAKGRARPRGLEVGEYILRKAAARLVCEPAEASL